MTDRNYWKILPAGTALFSLTVFAVSANIIPSILLRAANDFKISPELLAGATTVQFTGFVVATVLGGILADRIGKKNVFIAACIFTMIGSVIWFYASSLKMVFLGSLAMGMGGGVLESMSSALLSDLFPQKRKLFLNLSQASYCIGAASSPFLIGYLLTNEGISWRLIFVFLAIITFILLIFYIISRIPKSPEEESISFQILTSITRKWSFICPCILLFLYVLAETVNVVFMNYYLREQLHAPENWAIYSLSIFWVSMIFGRIICAFIPESFSYQKLIAVLMFSSGILMFSQALVHQWQFGIAIFALTGFAFSGTWPLIVGLTAKLNPGYSGTVIGTTIAVGAIGCILAAPVIGLYLKLFPFSLAFSFISAFLILAGILSLCVSNKVQAKAA